LKIRGVLKKVAIFQILMNIQKLLTGLKFVTKTDYNGFRESPVNVPVNGT